MERPERTSPLPVSCVAGSQAFSSRRSAAWAPEAKLIVVGVADAGLANTGAGHPLPTASRVTFPRELDSATTGGLQESEDLLLLCPRGRRPAPPRPVVQHASCKAVDPLWLVASGSAPRSSSALTADAHRLRTARCNGVVPFLSTIAVAAATRSSSLVSDNCASPVVCSGGHRTIPGVDPASHRKAPLRRGLEWTIDRPRRPLTAAALRRCAVAERERPTNTSVAGSAAAGIAAITGRGSRCDPALLP